MCCCPTLQGREFTVALHRRGRASLTLLVAKAEAAQAADKLRRALAPSQEGEDAVKEEEESADGGTVDASGEAANDTKAA